MDERDHAELNRQEPLRMDHDRDRVLHRITGKLNTVLERLPAPLVPVQAASNRPTQLQEHKGRAVWTDVEADAQRRGATLCRRCTMFKEGDPENNCGVAQALYTICVQADVALTVTRCPTFVAVEEHQSPPVEDDEPPTQDIWEDDGGAGDPRGR